MKRLTLLTLLVMMISFFSCKKKDDDNNGGDTEKTKHELLLEKTWYNNPNKGRGDHFFGSDGTLQVTNPTWSGTYVWGPNDSMTIIIPGGGTVNWWFKKISADYMEYWPTNELPENIYQFTTTKP